MSGHRIYLDTFTSLDDLPRKLHGNRSAVLAALHKVGRFSVFDATSTQALARTMTAIMHDGSIARSWGEYPWTYVELSAAPHREGGG